MKTIYDMILMVKIIVFVLVSFSAAYSQNQESNNIQVEELDNNSNQGQEEIQQEENNLQESEDNSSADDIEQGLEVDGDLDLDSDPPLQLNDNTQVQEDNSLLGNLNNNQISNDNGLDQAGSNDNDLDQQGSNDNDLGQQVSNDNDLGEQVSNDNDLDQVSNVNNDSNENGIDQLSNGGSNLDQNGMNQLSVDDNTLEDMISNEQIMNNSGAEFNPMEQNTDLMPVPDNQQPDIGPEVDALVETNDFGGVPPIIGTRRNMAAGEAPENYRVEYGDTLFDICDQLIDEPDYWPKLWSLNPFIKNPHFIFPGMQLSFYPGDSDIPPFLQVVTEDEIVPVDKGDIEEKELVATTKKKKQVLLREVEGEAQFSGLLTAKDIEQIPGVTLPFETYGKVYTAQKIPVNLPAFYFEDELEPLAVVRAGVNGSFLTGETQSLFMDVEEDVVKGTSYTVVRPGPKTYTKKNSDYVGYRYDFVAHIKIKNKSNGDVAIGRVMRTRLGVKPGDMIIPYRSTRRSVPLSIDGESQSFRSEIVGFDFSRGVFAGRGFFVFFDKINGQPNVGALIDIYQNVNDQTVVFKDSELPDIGRRVGRARVIDTQGSVVTAYVMKNVAEIKIGDRAAIQPL